MNINKICRDKNAQAVVYCKMSFVASRMQKINEFSTRKMLLFFANLVDGMGSTALKKIKDFD